MRSDWLRVALLLSEISHSIGSFGVDLQDKQALQHHTCLFMIKEKIMKFANNIETSEGLKHNC